MTTRTLRPNATVEDGFWTPSSGTLHGVTSDDSDATYAESGDLDMILGLATYALAAGERVKRFRVRGRASEHVAGSPPLELAATVGASTAEYSNDFFQGSSPQSVSSPWVAAPAIFSQSEIDGAQVAATPSGAAGTLRVYELYVDLDVWQRTDTPTVTTDPAGAGGPPPAITDTDRPTVESHTAALNDGTPGAWTRQVRVFSSAQFGAGGFDPATSEAVWEDTNTVFGTPSTAPGSPDTVQVGVPLDNNDDYQAYVRYGKNGVAGSTLWSEWGFHEFTIQVTLPTAPSVDVTVDQAQGRNTVEVATAALTHDSIETLEVRRSVDGGTTWRTIRGGLLDDVDPSTGYVFQDFDAPRGVSLLYRARSTEQIAGSPSTIASAWTTHSAVVHPFDGRVQIFAVPDFDVATLNADVLADPSLAISEQVTIHRPPGRIDTDGTPVAVWRSRGLSGDDRAFQVWAEDDHAVIDQLMRHPGTLLVKWHDLTQTYLKLLSRRQTIQDLGTEIPRRMWDVSAVVVEPGY